MSTLFLFIVAIRSGRWTSPPKRQSAAERLVSTIAFAVALTALILSAFPWWFPTSASARCCTRVSTSIG